MSMIGDLNVTLSQRDIEALVLSYLKHQRKIEVDTAEWTSPRGIHCYLSPEGRKPPPSLWERIKARFARKDQP